jgi:hypothetical protein
VVSPAPGGGASNVEYFVVENSVPQNYWSSRSITGNSNLTSPVVGADFKNDGKIDLIVRLGPECIRPRWQVPPLPDFKGIVAPVNSVLVPGGSVSFNITLTPLYGFTGDVTLGATSLPNGISVSYNPATVPHANGSSIVTLTASPSASLGAGISTLSGNSGTLTHSTAIPFTVNTSIGDFAGNLSVDTQNITEGGTALYPITIVPLGGFTGAVSISVSGIPAGSTATFSQNPVAGGSGTSTLSIVTF